MDTPRQPLIDTRALLGIIGVLLLAVGFFAGYFVGSSGRGNGSSTSVVADTREQQPTGGHTFNGVEVPPHDEQGHRKADVLLNGLACPCGQCSDALAECECDTAKEIRGVTAHLFTRGQSAPMVASQLEQHFGVRVSPAALAALAEPGQPSDGQASSGSSTSSSSVGLDVADILSREGS